MKAAHPAGRLALRVEGDYWNAYWAPEMDSMVGSILLGSLRMRLAEDYPPLKDGFMRCIVEDAGLKIDHWNDPAPAPEGERGGEA